ncbi:MAG: Ig-like domain-containing protein, partial [Planctomycetota bacterium]
FVLDPGEFGYKTFRVTAVAEDRGGNRAESEPVKVRFFRDRKGPALKIVNPGNGKTVDGKTNLVAEVEDDSGVGSVEFYMDGKRLGNAITNPPWEVAFDANSVPRGVHTLTTVATDRLGNETKKSIRFKTK